MGGEPIGKLQGLGKDKRDAILIVIKESDGVKFVK